jgi:hypothetical protein
MPTRIADIEIPDTRLVAEASELVRDGASPLIFHHSRSAPDGRRRVGAAGALLLGVTLYLAGAVAGYAVDLLFVALGWIPDRASAHLPDEGISWSYTTWLNIAFLLLAAALVVRFVRSGGASMLRLMGGPPATDHKH